MGYCKLEGGNGSKELKGKGGIQVDCCSGIVCEGNKTFQTDFVLALTCIRVAG